ncbi:Putative molybdopterin binding domain protein [Podospora comata]|uniref:Molybdopterin binding domain protein n=1 Tax=Podospora comata TaxID=48703 RepID=A0ABY6S0J2_PODCO|nr:Putative molybdopterin binding domain protein [Podospora comata]
MFSRLNQVARHLLRPMPNYGHTSAAASSVSKRSLSDYRYSSLDASERQKKNIVTGACLIIGNEILNGKVFEPANSHYLAKWCFSLGISLQRIDIIPDVEYDIIEAVRRLSHNYDIVVTSGGIGPTHDDITYESIAKAFHLPLVLHGEAYSLMKKKTAEHRDPVRAAFNFDVPSKELDGKKKMVLLPHDSSRPVEDQAILACRDKYWVPVSVVNGNVYILPGIPELFKHLLDGLTRHIKPRVQSNGKIRVTIKTLQPESQMADYLTGLAKRMAPKDIDVGSYPKFQVENTVVLVGEDRAELETVIPEILENLEGTLVSIEMPENPDGETEVKAPGGEES